MSEPSPSDKNTDKQLSELEHEIRRGRKFTLSEAIGRLAGPGIMKGVSPISQRQQTEVEIDEFLNQHLHDAPGALKTILSRRAKTSELLQNNYDKPLVVLASGIQRILDSEYLLKETVREADIEWGQVFGERPYFEQEGGSPHSEDPYTIESVRKSLTELFEKIAEAVA